MIRFALKEWSVVCEALRAGRQSILVRKGGIHDGPRGFQPEHEQFWLLPTKFHQSEAELVEPAHDLLPLAQASSPPAGRLQLSLQARVLKCFKVTRVEQLACLEPLQILTPDVLLQRFQYKRPGLHVLALEVFESSTVLDVPDLQEYAGCHSWVELQDLLGQQDLTLRPVTKMTHLTQLEQHLDTETH